MNEPQLEIYEFDEFRVDVSKRLLTKDDGVQIPLTPKVFDTLLYLIRHSGKVIEKNELMREIWTDSVVEENNLNQNISILRRVFGEKPGQQRFIVTIAGHGYRFVPEVREVSGFKSQTPKLAAVNEIRNPRFEIQNRNRLAALAVLSVFAIGVAGFYLWRRNESSVDTRIKTIAVLPFKPLVIENRNE